MSCQTHKDCWRKPVSRWLNLSEALQALQGSREVGKWGRTPLGWAAVAFLWKRCLRSFTLRFNLQRALMKQKGMVLLLVHGMCGKELVMAKNVEYLCSLAWSDGSLTKHWSFVPQGWGLSSGICDTEIGNRENASTQITLSQGVSFQAMAKAVTATAWSL